MNGLTLGAVRPNTTRSLAGMVAGVIALLAAPAALAQVPNDPLYATQWGPQQVRAADAWPISTGAGTTIAVVDSGVDFGHPELAAKLLQGATFLGCGSISCGNGDWRSGPAQRRQFDHPHGTHVAGIAAALTDNSTGIAGVAPDADILPVKVLDGDGGTSQDIALGIRWAADHGADVINLSLGALPGAQALVISGQDTAMKQAIAYARGKGALTVAAAGNDFVSICGTPAFDDGALCVASTDRREARSAFSNFALKPGLDAVAAPGGSAGPLCGEDIVSTVPLGQGKAEACGYASDYDEYAGTSMATPHVAGVAALLAAQGRTVQDVLGAIETTARKPATTQRGVYDPVYGYGIVDARAAVQTPRPMRR